MTRNVVRGTIKGVDKKEMTVSMNGHTYKVKEKDVKLLNDLYDRVGLSGAIVVETIDDVDYVVLLPEEMQ